MDDKKHILEMLKAEFTRWEELLASLSEEQITAPQLSFHLVHQRRDRHLRAWQQVSIAAWKPRCSTVNPSFPNG